jgi:preprotein translocase subunit SecD
MVVADLSPTHLKTGLDISGGARALVKAANQSLSSDNATTIASMIRNRLNVYGLEDIQVSPVQDLSGENYISIQIAGATPSDLKDLISQQGNFVAKIGNETIFKGDKGDIASVSRSGQQSGIQSCNQQSDGSYVCTFQFGVTLSGSAAEKFAEVTKNIPVSGDYLTENIELYLDGTNIENLSINKDLKGVVQTQISIQGSGSSASNGLDAQKSAKAQMNKLQTILETGSLPFKLEVVKLDTISPTLGKSFIQSILLAALVAILAVSIVVFVRYKRPKASLALLLISTSEIVIILGIAAVIQWSLDLASIAGILATIGTGIDSQIIILDEARGKMLSLKQRLKRAFSIILGSYFTAFVALIPLYSAAGGLFKGFAFTTIIGITVGVLITRPAFSDIINKIEKE